MNAPEVRQCRDEESLRDFGAIAVRISENRWAVMNPGIGMPAALGGHTDATDDDVEAWHVLA